MSSPSVQPATAASATPTRKRGGAPAVPRAPAAKRNKRPGVSGSTSSAMGGPEEPTPVASLWCQGRLNPFGQTLAQRQSLSRSKNTQVIEIFLPASLYKKKPTFLLPEQGHADQRTSYARFVYLFGYLANKSREPWKVPDPEDARKFTAVESPNRVTPTWEVVVSVTGVVLGYRLRLTELQTYLNDGMAGNLLKLIEANDLMAARTASGAKGGRQLDMRTGKPRAINRYSHANITSQVWQEMAMHVTGPAYIRDALSANATGNVTIGTPAYHLSNVCSVEHSHRIARNMGAAPHFYDSSIYAGDTDPEDGMSVLYGFPDPARVYMLYDHHLLPATLDKRWFPIRQSDPRRHARGRAEYEQVHGPGSGEYFDQCCVTTSDSSEACDIWYLTNQVTSDRKEIASTTSELHPDVGHARIRLKQIEWQETMGDILDPRGDVCPALQHVAAYRDAWLQENHDSMRVERSQTMINLSRFGDFWAQQLTLLETVAALKTAHKQIIVRIIAYMTVHLRTNDRIHIFNFGPAMSGKSFAMVFAANLFISGTSLNIADVTQRALCTPGKGNDGLRMIIEDALPSLLGAQSGNKTGQGGGTGEKENMIKGFMTSMQTALLSVTMEPSRQRDHVQADTCSLLDVAMNLATDMFDPPVLSRALVVIWPTSTDRPGEGPDMLTRSSRCSDSEVKASMQTLKTYWSRTEVLIAEIEYRIAAGIMPAVTMDAATMVFGLVAIEMKRRFGVDMQDQRHFNRFKAAVQVLCIHAAVDLVWDSPLSPIKDEPHSDAHYLLVEKHLVAKVEHAVFAIGLLSCQWQDDLSADVLHVMKTRFFPNSGEAIAANARGVVLDDDAYAPLRPDAPAGWLPDLVAGRKLTPAQEKKENTAEVQQYRREAAAYDAFAQNKQDWMFATLALPSNLCPRPPAGSRGAIPSQQELAEHVATQIYQHLKDKPLKSEVVAVLMRLLRDTSDATRRTLMCVGDAGSEERASNVPSLVLTPDCIKMSLPVLARAEQSSVLLTAVTSVVSLLFNSGAITPSDRSGKVVMLYGETMRDTPYVWKLVVAHRQAGGVAQTAQDREMMRVRSPNFFDPVLVESTGAFLRAIEPVGMDENRLLRLFKSTTPWHTIDTDLDEYAVELRSLELGLNQEMQARGVTNRTQVTERQLFDHMYNERVATLPASQVRRVYPTCFSGMDSVACFAEHRLIEGVSPEKYSLRSRQEASFEKRKTFASFEDMGDLLERMQRVYVDEPIALAAKEAAAVVKAEMRSTPDTDYDMLDQEAEDALRDSMAAARGFEDDAYNASYADD